MTYSDYPREAQSIPRVGDNKALDLERIVALRPDLIVVWRHGNAARQIDRLRDLHVPLYFSEPRKLDDIPATIDKLGTLLGTAQTQPMHRMRFAATSLRCARVMRAGRPSACSIRCGTIR